MKHTIFIFLIVLFSGNCGRTADPGYEFLPLFPGLTGIPLASFNPIRETRELVVPNLVGAFNPGLFQYEDGFLLMPRFYGYQSTAAQNQIAVIKLDSNFLPSGKLRILNTKIDGTFSYIEDPRIFRFKNELWVAVSAISKYVRKGTQQMFISKLSISPDGVVSAAPFVHIKTLNDPENLLQKNWSPFEFNGELHFVYSIHPHRIVKVNTETGNANDVALTPGFSWKFGSPRGGSPIVPFGKDEFLSIFHSSKEYQIPSGKIIRIYVMGAYTFQNTPPFRVTRYTEKIIADDSYYDDSNHRMIIFPNGIHITHDTIFVVLGKNDDGMILSKIDPQALLQGMTLVKQHD